MKLSAVLSFLALAATSVLAAPVETQETDATAVPAEAVIGYMNFDGATDIAILPFSNSTNSGVLFVNTTILNAAYAEAGSDFKKREADAEAEAWHWLRLDMGQPLYKREAEAEAEAWHWLRLNMGQPLY